jgi:aspartyl/asparaginyl beta-hydroxylase (cupin superfamily)
MTERGKSVNDAQVSQLLTAAALEQRAQRPDNAVRHLEQVVAIAPDHPQALNSLGTLALGRSDFASARDWFARAAAADPKEPVLWLNLARAHRELGEDDGELAALDRIIAIDARHFIALLRKAQLFQRQGKDVQAGVLWNQVTMVAPPPEQLSSELREMIAAGQELAQEQQRKLASAMDGAMAPHLGDASSPALRRVRAAIDANLGRRRIYTHECAGLNVPFLPADEFLEREHFSWMADLEAATPAIRAELKNLLETGDDGFAPYVQYPSGYPDSKWSHLDHSERWSAYFLWRHGKRIDAHCARCPETAAALAKVPLADHFGRAPTAFFSLLHPRTHIPPHTGVTNARTIVHLALIVPDGCSIRVGGETRQWVEGQAFGFDDTIEHEAWNNSDELRAVLILDVWNPHIAPAERAILNRYFEAADSSGLVPVEEY